MFLISTVVHIAAILILVLLPLIFIGAIPEADLLTFLSAAPAPPPAPAPPAPPAPLDPPPPARVIPPSGFVQPIHIPEGVLPAAPEPMPNDFPSGFTSGIPSASFGYSSEGISGSSLGSVLTGAAAPEPLPPPPRPVQKPVVRRGGEVQQSKLIRRVEPVYPRLAIQARVSGTVILDVKVDEEGNVESIRVLQGHPLLIEAAKDAVAQWKYSPTILNGEPVPVIATVTVIFNLR